MLGDLSRGDRKVFSMEEIRELIHLLDETSLAEICIEHEETKIQLKKFGLQIPSVVSASTAPVAFVPSSPTVQNGGAVQTPTQTQQVLATETDDKDIHTVTSPMVGTFYRSPSPDAPPFVDAGAKVSNKTVICIVEAMKLMNEIEAEVNGEIVEVMAQNGDLVEYGQPLFKIRLA